MWMDDEDGRWIERPWVMAGLLGLAGAICGAILDIHTSDVPVWRQLLATFLIVAGVGFALTAKKLRLIWAAIYAVGAGSVLAFVGNYTIRYASDYELVQWPFLAAMLGILISAPLFQTIRDEGKWRFPYQRFYGYVWSDAIIGAASLAFVGITFGLFGLVGALFNLVGIRFFLRLWDHGWIIMGLAGISFGLASAILSERDGLSEILQRVVQLILSMLAPILAAAVALFLLALPFTGLEPLWETEHATPILLVCAAGALLFVNAVIGSGKEERSPSRILQISAGVLSLSILPFSAMAAVSMGLRINQYGWTPERLWGFVAVYIALLCGLAYFWSAVKGRLDFDDVVRPLNTKLAITTCGIALLLAMPFIDFGAISTRSQLARLESGQVSADKFDWAALRYDFGPAGRKALERIANSGPADQKVYAAKTIKSENRWEVKNEQREIEAANDLDKRLRVIPSGAVLPDNLRKELVDWENCQPKNSKCTVLYNAKAGEAVIVRELCNPDTFRGRIEVAEREKSNAEVRATVQPKSQERRRCEPVVHRLVLNGSQWQRERVVMMGSDAFDRFVVQVGDGIRRGKVEVRSVSRRQVFVDGQPVGDLFE